MNLKYTKSTNSIVCHHNAIRRDPRRQKFRFTCVSDTRYAFIFAGPHHVRERATQCVPAERAATTFALGRLALLLFKQHT